MIVRRNGQYKGKVMDNYEAVKLIKVLIFNIQILPVQSFGYKAIRIMNC